MDQEALDKLVEQNKKFYQLGKVASYIPALAEVEPDQLGVLIYNLKTKKNLNSGDSSVRFAIESISKVPVLEDHGTEYLLEKISTEPTGFAFNSILNMEITHQTKPLNPFINAGAITTSLIAGKTSEERFKRILKFTQEICDDKNISLNNDIYKSELKTGDINRSIAYYLKENNMIDGEVTDILTVYFKQCSLEVTADSLAKMASVIANNGVKPWDNQRLFTEESAIFVKSLMLTAGLYNESGEFSSHVGIPTKSGVGGGLAGVASHEYGIGIFSPPLDSAGNSTAGIYLLKDIVKTLNIDIFK